MKTAKQTREKRERELQTAYKETNQEKKMKFWKNLASLVVVLAAFFRVGYAEETEESDDFEGNALEYGASQIEDAEP